MYGQTPQPEATLQCSADSGTAARHSRTRFMISFPPRVENYPLAYRRSRVYKGAAAHTVCMQYEKVFVAVLARFDTEGNMKPVAIEWENGEEFRISKVTDIRTAPPPHVGSLITVRYKIIVQGKERELYREKYSNQWFVEKPSL